MFSKFYTILFIVCFFCNTLIAESSCDEKGLYYYRDFELKSDGEGRALFEKAKKDRLLFWREAAENIEWFQRWHTLLHWSPPNAKWFDGGTLNVCYNCVDRHLADKKDKPALIWVSEDGNERILTFGQLHEGVCKLANVLKGLGVGPDDCVAIYMPMTPEAITAMLACARIGAMHSVIFGGTGGKSLKEKLCDAKSKVLITADGGFRKGKIVPYKQVADEVLEECEDLQYVIVSKRTDIEISMQTGRDFWYHEIMQTASSVSPPEILEAEHPLFVLYTSGTTGKPKGILHTCGGYLVGVNSTFRWVFDIKPDDIYWCTADIGWITGHSYVVYGPMSCGVTQIIYEGAFDYPSKEQAWKIIDRYKPTIFYTAPTLIRMFMKWGTDFKQNYDLSSLRIIGSIGEPLNPETWQWFHENVGASSCPIVDTWFQTETGAFVIAPLPGVTPLRPGSVSHALPGYDVAILNNEGDIASDGFLAITSPFPSMMRGVLNDPERYYKTYWEKWGGRYYYAGDFAYLDEDGYLWVRGRADEVLKVAGHRIGTAEVENAILEVEGVCEAAAVGIEDFTKGHLIITLVVLKKDQEPTKELQLSILQEIEQQIGKYARPEIVYFVADLPKTKSGKILRRVIKNAIEGKPSGDLSSIDNVHIIESLQNACEKIREQLR